MKSHEVAGLFDQAVQRLRGVVESGDSDDGSDLIRRAADSGAEAVGLAVGTSRIPTVWFARRPATCSARRAAGT
ncbi:hypothetical protein AB0J89_10370 [Micromonospora chokoriensis]